ncbi:hypothetical protein DSO57_1017903 [Entomophthora muscae]|uniref:Uncharacterized protein n=1 Tax=Entomophthora muscae TaxID=34485 RepID=A0ACC2RJ67_9FUNG|nr:hypothetical protein DSO57_1017903 [Entomophthora muscae]
MLRFNQSLIKRVFWYLDRRAVLDLSLTCRTFYHAATPVRFHTLALRRTLDKGYMEFLNSKGVFFTRLKCDIQTVRALYRRNLSIAQLFPYLSTVDFDQYNCTEQDIKVFAVDIQRLCGLKHLSLDFRDSRFIGGLQSVIRKLESLYIPDDAGPLFKWPFHYVGLKTLYVDPSYSRWSDQTYPFEVLVITNGQAIDALNPATGVWGESFCYHARYFFKLFPTDYFDYMYGFNFMFPNYYCREEDLEPELLPGAVEYCKITHGYTARYNEDFSCLKEVPSLDLELGPHKEPVLYGYAKFQTTKLSLKTDDAEFHLHLAWVLRSFPNLRHLYLHNQIPHAILPFSPKSFPHLTHFYSSVPQSDLVWNSLAAAFPKLVAIHTAVDQANQINLQDLNQTTFPYQSIDTYSQRDHYSHWLTNHSYR